MTDKPFVALKWLDAHATASTTAYELHELPHRAAEITTYGLLLRDDETGVSIASEEIGGGMYRGITFVLRALVVSITPIKPVRKHQARTRALPPAPPPPQTT